MAPALHLLLIGPGRRSAGHEGQKAKDPLTELSLVLGKDQNSPGREGRTPPVPQKPWRVQLLTLSRNQWEGTALPIGRLRAC